MAAIREDKIRHFNGGLFDDDLVLELDGDAMDTHRQHRCAGLGLDRSVDLWHAIRARNRRLQARAVGGALHRQDDIMLIVEPVLMEPLRGNGRAQAEVTQQSCAADEGGEAAAARPLRRSAQAAGIRGKIAATRVSTRRAEAGISCTWRCACCWTCRRK